MTITREERVAFVEAVEEGQLATVKQMLEEHSDLRENADLLGGCLDRAACEGQLAMVKFLVEYGVDVNYQDPSAAEYGAISSAVMNCHFEIAKYLHSQGALLSTDLLEENALFDAIDEGRSDIAQWALESQIDPHVVYRVVGGGLMNALSFAIDRGETEIAKMLEAAGCRLPVEGEDTPVADYSEDPEEDVDIN
jgi:ankyrin repeat protein